MSGNGGKGEGFWEERRIGVGEVGFGFWRSGELGLGEVECEGSSSCC